jgi:hypothetical protein
LPAFDYGVDWFAYGAVELARKASEQFGVTLTALHERRAAGQSACELEIQAPRWTPPSGTRWIASGDLDALVMEPAALSALLRAWFQEQESGAVPARRPPLERRGWHAEAAAWILFQCRRLRYTPTGPVEQVKGAWSLSAILRLNTMGGTLYFKADYAKPPPEPAVIDALARRWPRHVPEVIAAEFDRGWMLMRDFGGRALDREPFVRWQAAARAFSAIQLACSWDLEPWWRLGCPDLRIPVLTAHMDSLLDDAAALRTGEPGGLTSAEAARLQQLRPCLHAMWDALAAIAVPASLVQQDFRHGNLVMSRRTYLFYDWSDTVISHPFFACCRFLDYLPADPPSGRGLTLEERRRRVTQAYLEPWRESLDQAALARAFALARRLNPVYVAIRATLDAAYCEPDSFWGRTMRERPATELRRLLASMNGE